MRKIHSAGGVIIGKDKRIIVVSQHNTSWSLPKGCTEEGETIIETTYREIHEETGLSKHELELIEELGTYSRYGIDKYGKEDKNVYKSITMFLLRTDREALKPIDAENPQALWIEADKIADLLTHPKDKEFFLGIMDKLG